ncbi:beta-lactoglobulin isoform X2 [Pongo pygmaeus]|uniref:beta-lactoglobulin isoform X2 n=1 Tax=Pongo pygmaeus TaxID=9600 RepID=UPI0023E17967|nr:beta-lactoglobulin isoform X2 [Pongo pygmaeus]
MALEKGPLLLLALGLGLAGAQKALEEVPVQPGFDAQKALILRPRDPQGTVTVFRARATHHTKLRPKTRLQEGGEGVCKETNIIVHPTQLQGQYQGSFEGGSMHVRFVSTDYSNLILYVRFEDDEVTNLWVLLARRMLEDPKWLGRYLEYVEKFHLQKAPVFNIDGPCPPP